jgi:hypothetical protein
MNAHELLTEPIGFLAPARALEGLSPDFAERRVDGAPHSIAEIVAHLNFWQIWFIRRAEGMAAPMVQHAAEGWPARRRLDPGRACSRSSSTACHT